MAVDHGRRDEHHQFGFLVLEARGTKQRAQYRQVAKQRHLVDVGAGFARQQSRTSTMVSPLATLNSVLTLRVRRPGPDMVDTDASIELASLSICARTMPRLSTLGCMSSLTP